GDQASTVSSPRPLAATLRPPLRCRNEDAAARAVRLSDEVALEYPVEDPADGRAEERRSEVDPDLAQVGAHERRTEGSGRVHRGAAERDRREVDHDEGEGNRERGVAGIALRDGQDDQQEEGCEDRLERERL